MPVLAEFGVSTEDRHRGHRLDLNAVSEKCAELVAEDGVGVEHRHPDEVARNHAARLAAGHGEVGADRQVPQSEAVPAVTEKYSIVMWASSLGREVVPPALSNWPWIVFEGGGVAADHCLGLDAA